MLWIKTVQTASSFAKELEFLQFLPLTNHIIQNVHSNIKHINNYSTDILISNSEHCRRHGFLDIYQIVDIQDLDCWVEAFFH